MLFQMDFIYKKMDVNFWRSTKDRLGIFLYYCLFLISWKYFPNRIGIVGKIYLLRLGIYILLT